MIKEYLEALEHIYYGSQGYGETDKYYKYLKEYLESIDNANPNEALKCLKLIEDAIETKMGLGVVNAYLINTIKQALLKAQEQEKENAEYKYLEKQLGVSLDMILNLMKNSNTLDEHCHTQDIYFDYKGKLISGSFIKLEYNNEFIINVETDEMFDSPYDTDDYDLKVKDYKKTWWLREDKSE